MISLRKIGICRICLGNGLDESKKYLSLFESYNGSTIFEKINSITNVNIKEGDELPTNICPNCLLQLENAILFKNKCEASNRLLLGKVEVGKKGENNIIEIEPTKEEAMEVEVDPNPEEHCTEYLDTDIDLTTTDKTEVLEAPVKRNRAKNLQLICDDCGGSFPSKCKLRVHWKRIHQPDKLICPRCRRLFRTYKALRDHIQQNTRNCHSATKVRIEGKGRERVFYCKECPYSTPRIKDIDTHLSIHTGDRRFQCKDCSKTFTQHASLQSHRESSHKDYKIDTSCHLCGKHLQGRTKYYKHMQTHNPKNIKCEVCNSLFKNKRYLAAHMLRHSGVKSFSCEVCAASFYTYTEVYNHINKVHLKSRNIKCDECDYKLSSKAALKRHKSRHTGTNVICMYCGQFCENDEKLAIHQKRHLEKNVQCPQCDKKYHKARSLSQHLNKVHQCTYLIEKKEEVKIVPEIKQEESPRPKKDIVILMSPPTIILN